MDFSFSEEQVLYRDSLRRFLEEKLRPRVKEVDEKGIPRDFVKEAARVGLWAMTVPPQYGGQGASWLTTAIAAEEVGRADFTLATAVMFLLESAWGYILSEYGGERLKEEVLPRVTSGDWFLGVASTEPGGGSDVAGIRTRAVKEGDNYIINGEKAYISGGVEARVWGGGHLVLAKTSPELGHRGISMIYVDASSEGVSVERIENMGRMGISTAIMRYNGVRAEGWKLVGEENRGFYYAMDGFNRARVLVSAACIGAAEAVLEMGLEHLRTREAFGKRLKEFQSLAFEAAELYTQLEMARLLTYKAAWAIDMAAAGKGYASEVPTLAAMAKLTGPQVSFNVIKSVMMWHGALGYTKDMMIEAAFRGEFSYLVGAEGALNIMRLIISRGILGRD